MKDKRKECRNNSFLPVLLFSPHLLYFSLTSCIVPDSAQIHIVEHEVENNREAQGCQSEYK